MKAADGFPGCLWEGACLFALQLGHELRKLFAKKRTWLGLLVFVLVQNVIVLLFRFTAASDRLIDLIAGHARQAEGYLSHLTIATAMVFPLAYLLVPLYLALVGGDLVAKEAEEGTLRLVLARPVSRTRLLAIKWLAGMAFAGLLVLALGGLAVLFAAWWFPAGGLFVYVPGEVFSVFEPRPGLWRYAAAHLLMISKAGTILSLAFMFSCFDVKPAAATVLGLSVVYASGILQRMPFFQEVQPWFLTYHLNIWLQMLAEPIPWRRVGESAGVLAGVSVLCVAIGGSAFQRRDFKTGH